VSFHQIPEEDNQRQMIRHLQNHNRLQSQNHNHLQTHNHLLPHRRSQTCTRARPHKQQTSLTAEAHKDQPEKE
jgi:hypothetical protein